MDRTSRSGTSNNCLIITRSSVYQSEPHVIENPTHEIPTRITRRKRRPYQNPGRAVNYHALKNLKKIKIPKRYDIPTILSANVRSLPKKVDEIEQIALLNSVGAICITETWLSPEIPDSSISIPGYNLFRRDRIEAPGGGVCVYVDQNIPCKLLEFNDQTELESIWISMRPHSLPREVTSIVVGVVYHSTSNGKPENIILRDHVQKNLDAALLKQPNALIILTGDFNPTSTGFNQKYITQVNSLKQLVTFKTRDSGILDWLFTNRPKGRTIRKVKGGGVGQNQKKNLSPAKNEKK